MSLLILGMNLYLFFLLFIPKELHFNVWVWGHAGGPNSPWKLNNSYRSLGLEKGTKGMREIICCSHFQT